MATSNSPIRFAALAALLLSVALVVSGCGRRGAPEPPPSSQVLATDEQGRVIETEPEKPDKPFFLDPLIQ